MTEPPVAVRYAESDDDVIEIHKFLCVVAGPNLPGPVNPLKSINEVWRVVHDEFALMAMQDGRLVGTLGVIRADFWWGDVPFFANRWAFCLRDAKAWKPLLREAKSIAKECGVEFHLISEARGRITIFNRSPDRSRH